MLRTPGYVYPMVVGGSLVFSYPMWNYVRMPAYSDKIKHPRMENRTAVVTGATGNLGLALSFHLAKRNVRTIMACRDIDKCKSLRREIVMKTKTNNIVCRHLDLEDVESINKFVKDLEKTEPHVDILINLAAVKDVPTKEITKLMDKLKESANITKDSRIINVIGTPNKSWFRSFGLDDINFDKRPYDSVKAYKQSKLALAYFTILLEKYNRTEKNTIYVYATSPVFPSNRILRSFPKYDNLLQEVIGGVKELIGLESDRAVMNIVKCALEPSLTEPGYSGKLYTWFLSSWGWKGVDENENLAKLVWNRAAEMLVQLPDSSKKKEATVGVNNSNKDDEPTSKS